MKLIESKAELLPWEPGIEGVYKAIERAGRTCYKSEDKITEDSAKGFVDRMIASKHTAMLEHGTVYLTMPGIGLYTLTQDHNFHTYANNKYSKCILKCIKEKDDDVLGYGTAFITTNLRVLVENNWLDDLKHLCDPTEFHEKRYSFKFTCSRAIANELIRHRVFSFAQESQRYCNYSKDKFSNDITFIKPGWLNYAYEDIPTDSELRYLAKQYSLDDASQRFIASLVESKYAYMALLQKGCSPQQARDVLPNATKTEIVMTGYESDWRYLFDLRLFGKTGAPHPDMVDLMGKAAVEAKKNGIWDYIMSHPSKFE